MESRIVSQTEACLRDSWTVLSCICPGVCQKQPCIKTPYGISEGSHPVCRFCSTHLVYVTGEISLFPCHSFDIAVTSMSHFFEYLSEVSCVITSSSCFAVRSDSISAPSSKFPCCPWYDRFADVISVCFISAEMTLACKAAILSSSLLWSYSLRKQLLYRKSLSASGCFEMLLTTNLITLFLAFVDDGVCKF